MDANNVLFAFTLTVLAGLSTGIGSVIAFFAKKTNTRLLSITLGFSAGVMIYVSLVEIFQEAKERLIGEVGQNQGYLLTIIAFFSGMLISALIDKMIPECGNPHEMHNVGAVTCHHKRNLFRMGLFAAVAIAVHNFPEGIATFISGLGDSTIGVSIAIAVAIHNIPEGIAVSMPIFYATGSKRKAFTYSFISGLAEPLGAVIGFLFFSFLFNGIAMGLLLAAVAGIMVFISLDELLPAAQKYGKHHLAIYGMIGGMIIMAISLYFCAP